MVAKKRTKPLPKVPPRSLGWEGRLIDILHAEESRDFQWGTSDCLTLVSDCCTAVSGVDPMKDIRGYKTEAQANEIMAARGYSSVADALAECFEEIAPAMARRGDCGVVELRGVVASVVVMGAISYGRSERGLIKFPTNRVTRAFKVG